jgi:acyl carrier protein
MTVEALKDIIADLLEVEPSSLERDTLFNAQGDFDSLKVVLLMAALEEDFNLNVPPEKAWSLNTIQDIIEFAEGKGLIVTE